MKHIISIIRERGQLTIPDTIRKVVSWANPSSAVSISVTGPDEIVIKPHMPKYDAKKIWQSIRKSRAVMGKGGINGVEFLIKDRSRSYEA